jgi:site-specific recombinase XerD
MELVSALFKFLLQLEADGRSAHTIGQYRRHLIALARWAAQVGLSDDVGSLDHEALARFLASTAARTRPDGAPKRAASVNALRGSVKGFFGFAYAAGFVAQDPSRLVRRALCGPPPPRGLSAEDRRRLLEVLGSAHGTRDHVLFALMLGTGMRLGSAVGLDVEDLDLERAQVNLRHGKGDRSEVAFLSAELVALLASFVGDRCSGPLFLGRGQGRITGRHVHRRLLHWLGKAGVRGRFSPHSLRHTFATALYQRTHDILLVREALGHRSIASTLVYAHPDRDRLRAMVTG